MRKHVEALVDDYYNGTTLRRPLRAGPGRIVLERARQWLAAGAP